jgi:type IV fimbrial biogenesis protein FimT
MSLVELMVGVAIVAILFALGAPTFTAWIQSAQIRTATEAMQNGLMVARAEAVRRNTFVRFQLTDSLDDTCNVTATGTNWVVSLNDPSGACLTPPASPTDPNPPAPAIIQTRAGAEGSPNVQVVAGQAAIVFNGLGRVTPIPPAGADANGDIRIDVNNDLIGGPCALLGGPMRCLRVVVSTSGQVRMCDPMFNRPDPQGC